MKILIRLPNWLGDVVMSTAFIGAVRAHYPDARIDVVIKKELCSIATLIPGINKIHPFSKQEHNGLSGVYRFGKSLRAEKYDLFFNLPTSLSSLVLVRAAAVKKRIGFNKEGGRLLLTNAFKKPLNTHRVDEYISLLEQFTGSRVGSREVRLNVDEPLTPVNDGVVINFNSEASSRRMPLDKAKAILNLLTNTFTNAHFIFIGSAKEAIFVDKIIDDAENRDRIENMAGKTDLIGLINIMSAATVMLSTDSGPAHLANSVNTPVVVLFGAGNEHNTAPYNKQNLAVLRYGKLSCEPCVRNTCKLYGIPKCMELLDELQIIETLSLYLLHAKR